MGDQPPILSAAFWRRTVASGGAEGGEVYGIDVRTEIAAYPGPAMLLESGGKVLFANMEAGRLVNALAAGEAQDIRVLLASVAATGRPALGQIYLAADTVTGESQALYYLTALAAGHPAPPSGSARPTVRQVMILGRDGSAEYAMRNALIASRDLYRDLSRCSSDFSWQTDDNGAFTFVSAKGALGYSAQALNGRRSQDMFDTAEPSSIENPFISRTPVENVEVRLRDAKGETRYCRVDVLPVYDRNNKWLGARGVSSDFTEAKRQQLALEFMQQRELQVRAIVDAVHNNLDRVLAFNEAAGLLSGATGASLCLILGLDAKRRLRVLGESASGDKQENYPVLTRIELEMLETRARLESETLNLTDSGHAYQITATTYAGALNGVILLQNPSEENFETSKPDTPGMVMRSLSRAVAGNIGMAIAHDNQMRQLAELSRTDDLTGLMNRRAFMEDLHLRHRHIYRVSRSGALLYIDLDNFKPVNDRFGHAAGDQILKEFSNILREHSRIGDLCARLGGDEFAIWLEDTDAEGAAVKARHLIEAAKSLPRLAGIQPPPDMPKLCISIGIAIADPNFSEQLQQLIGRADEVMYQAKRKGKGSLIIAEPPCAAASGTSIKG